MSNHSGSRMVNEILIELQKQGAFSLLNKKKSQKLVIDIVHIALDYDCNIHEVLEDIAEQVRVCSCCLKPRKIFKDDMCKKCYTENYVEG
jgi:recombinational DNA repair protein RecR